MSNETSEREPASITELAHERDGDGELLPVDEEIEIHGELYKVPIIPPTTGESSEWKRKIDDEPEELGDEIVDDLLEDFVDLGPEEFGGAESWTDVRPIVTDALASVVLAKLFDVEDSDEFRRELSEAIEEEMAGNPPSPTEEEPTA